MTKRYVAFFAALVLVLVASGCEAETPKDNKDAKKPVPPTANFAVEAIGGIDARDRPETAAKAEAEAKNIKKVVDAFYTVAFVDPAKWVAGKHPELVALFATEAQSSVATNLGSLALTDTAPLVSKVKITDQRITKVAALFEDDFLASHAVATIAFSAIATAKAKSQQPIDVTHSMTIWLRPEGEGWRIYAYSSDLKADSKVKAAAFGAPTGGTA